MKHEHDHEYDHEHGHKHKMSLYKVREHVHYGAVIFKMKKSPASVAR
jgi:hypothetical protein